MCTEPVGVGSSLTLCANFTYYPDNAKRYVELGQTLWKRVSPSEETIWQCYDSACTNSPPPMGYTYSYSEDWGRCLHVDNVNVSSVFKFSIEDVFPTKPYPSNSSDFVRREVLFNVQG